MLHQGLFQIDNKSVALACDDVGMTLNLAASLDEFQSLAVVMLLPPDAVYNPDAAEETGSPVPHPRRHTHVRAKLLSHELSLNVGPLKPQVVMVIICEPELRCGAQMFCGTEC